MDLQNPQKYEFHENCYAYSTQYITSIGRGLLANKFYGYKAVAATIIIIKKYRICSLMYLPHGNHTHTHTHMHTHIYYIHIHMSTYTHDYIQAHMYMHICIYNINTMNFVGWITFVPYCLVQKAT